MSPPSADGAGPAGGSPPARPPTAWLVDRVRLGPRLLDRAPAWVRRTFDHAWAPFEAISAQAGRLPARLWLYLLTCSGGYVVVTPGESRYQPGPYELRGRTVDNVALVSVQDLAAGNERPLHVLGHLADHYLGCAGQLEGEWLSDGGAARPRWRQAGVRLAGLYALGYGLDEVARAGARDYFAQSLAVYCHDRRRLNVADPQIEKWLRTTLFDDRFWSDD